MRPALLTPLFQSASVLPKIGPKLSKLLAKLTNRIDGEEARVVDLLFHLPFSLIDRQLKPSISALISGEVSTIKIQVDHHQAPPRGNQRLPYRVQTHDETGELDLVFFHSHTSFIEKSLPVGEIRYVSGKVEDFRSVLQMSHPDYIVKEEDLNQLPLKEAVYPLTAGLSGKLLNKALIAAQGLIPTFPEWLDPELCKRNSWPSAKQAISKAHAPISLDDLDPLSLHVSRLAYDEFLATQLALGITRKKMLRQAGTAKEFSGESFTDIRNALPFELTGAQNLAIEEIQNDLKSPTRMLRLLQGDVGSGKTLVGLAAMASSVEAGFQAALMAPTEVLAKQHFRTLKPLCEKVGLSIEILTGKDKVAHRRPILEKLKSGELDLVVGTHALFQDSVVFHNLGLIVVDEQHRFGVHQRLALSGKGSAVDVLVMTATPIPRTLVLTFFGDMDVSKLDEKPVGRKPIETRSISSSRLDDVVNSLKAAVNSGKKAYWVCPLVEEAEVLELTSAQERFEFLSQQFPDQVGLIHGRMTPTEKDQAMEAFTTGVTKVLVATTVIEVGVDVPDATIMIIEHAERFGLSQLHQLRGRVGRSSEASNCVLLYQGPLGEMAKSRLSIMKETEDGFRIAEEDLRLRGEGEVLGTRQSGLPSFKIANPQFHGDLLEIARKDSQLILEKDPDLTSQRGQALRVLLYLFGLDESIRYLRSG